jgi:anti-sigma regulatory factor (Ser/Thr protein kinase)
MTGPDPFPDLPTAEDVAWMRVEDPSAPGAVRRRAVELGERVGLGEDRVGELAIVATEVATNLVKYAEQGVVLLRVLRLLRDDEPAGVELVALDEGPGVRDVHALFEDGTSSSGSLGIGLGAVRRLATSSDVHSVPGRGTVLTATFWPQHDVPPPPVAGLTRPLEGEDECGDAYAVRRTDAGYLLVLSDGLGHGSLAARASTEAVHVFRESSETSPAALLRAMHRGISTTRGAAVAVARVDVADRRLTYAGVGNVAGRLVAGGRPRSLMSMPGIVGHNLRSVQDVTHDLEPDSWLVMHSDGLSDKWDTQGYPGLLSRSALVVATTLMRDAAVRRDDAGVLACWTGQPR